MLIIFKRIKADLKEIFELVQKHPELKQMTKKEMLVAQQLITDSLKKLKRSISYSESVNQGDLFK